MQGAGEEMLNRLLIAVMDWLRREFVESLLISNGVENRSQKEVTDRIKAIKDYEDYKPQQYVQESQSRMRMMVRHS